MGGPLPLGDPAPADGLLPPTTRTGAEARAFGVYVHVPFCRVRCGYCDFNTYTAGELRGTNSADYAAHAIGEIRMARGVLEASGLPAREAATVFFGGGTPTLLPAGDLIAMLGAVRDEFGLGPGAEVTTEANPDSVGPDDLRRLADAGFTRVSFGMQSAVPHVLATLDRTHDPARVPLVVGWARDAGLAVSLDLIYATPGESIADWQRSVDAVIALAPDHVSAYSLIVEDGTKLARRIRKGDVATPDDDLAAQMYELADERLAEAGYDWYEVSNWARRDEQRSRHNLGYWRGDDWWGVGPGAHSHVGGVRWWNVKHPAAYADRVLAGVSPAAGRETLDHAARRTEVVMLTSRIREGLPIASLAPDARVAVAGLVADELVDARSALSGRVVLTRRGRLLADAVVRRLLDAVEPVSSRT